MRFLVLVVFIFGISVSLNAQEATAPIETTQEAIKLFNAQQYDAAYQAFYTLFLKHSSHARINFYLGLSALATKRVEEAIGAFERVLLVDPDATQARIQLAQLYFVSKNYDAAQKECDRLLAFLPKNHKHYQSIQEIVEKINQSNTPHSFGAQAMLGVQYDSNINNDIGTNSFVLDPNVLLGGVKGNSPVGDIIHQEFASFFHRYDFKQGYKPYSIVNNVTAFAQNYLQNAQRNILFVSASSAIMAERDVLTPTLKVHADRVLMAWSTLMSTLGVDMSLRWSINKELFTQGYIKVQNKMYAPTMSTSNGAYVEVGDMTMYNLSSNINLNLNVSALDEYVPASATLDRTAAQAIFGANYKVDDKLSTGASIVTRLTRFRQESNFGTFNLGRRWDTNINSTLQASYQLLPKVTLGSSISYMINNSTLSAFTYNKYVVGINVMGQF